MTLYRTLMQMSSRCSACLAMEVQLSDLFRSVRSRWCVAAVCQTTLGTGVGMRLTNPAQQKKPYSRAPESARAQAGAPEHGGGAGPGGAGGCRGGGAAARARAPHPRGALRGPGRITVARCLWEAARALTALCVRACVCIEQPRRPAFSNMLPSVYLWLSSPWILRCGFHIDG